MSVKNSGLPILKCQNSSENYDDPILICCLLTFFVFKCVNYFVFLVLTYKIFPVKVLLMSFS